MITATSMDEYFSFHYDGEFATPLLVLRRWIVEDIFKKKDWNKPLQLGDIFVEKISACYIIYDQGHFNRPIMVWNEDTMARLGTIFEVTK